jgi:hypothetical protein
MRRLHLIELHEQPWLPRALRDVATDLLRIGIEAGRIYHPILPLLAQAIRASGETSILDLCSGGGGPIPTLRRALAAECGLDVPAHLSDLAPNLARFEQIAGDEAGRVDHVREPLDATRVPAELPGFRTLFTCFHHFRPAQARAVLEDAWRRRRGIGVFEYTERSLFGLSQIVTAPLVTAALVPRIRPFRWWRIALTYALPIIPALFSFDGLVSQLRTYTVDELREMTRPLRSDDYTWQIGQLRHPTFPAPLHLTYLLGHPTRA